ncbi:hypothetical protein SLEP1_g20671 [Rubroshorea leprosula]|uniref:Uncharacterized protein n=1 Tax=Rubroshorea leprosula TaxID=152421 RepID=A0AAV5J8V4_9ROSI|nr:hypothetical protein SLEP1_g20671 [Rubroshorea leprosula]
MSRKQKDKRSKHGGAFWVTDRSPIWRIPPTRSSPDHSPHCLPKKTPLLQENT